MWFMTFVVLSYIMWLLNLILRTPMTSYLLTDTIYFSDKAVSRNLILEKSQLR